MSESFMAHPRDEFERVFKGRVATDRYGYQLGQLVVAMEILTVIKSLEDEVIAEGVGKACAPAIISALGTLLIELELFDKAVEQYEWLNEARKIALEHVPELGGNVPVEPGHAKISLADVSPPEHSSRTGRIRGWQRERRNRRASS